MAYRQRKRRYTATPSHTEVNLRAIRPLPSDGWKLWGLEEFSTVGTVPKNYLSYGNPYSSTAIGYIAKKGRTQNDVRECITEEIISKIGKLLPLQMAESRLARLSKTDVRFLSKNFVKRGHYELLHGIEIVAKYFETNPSEVEQAFDLKDRKSEQRFYAISTVITILDEVFPSNSPSLREGFFKMIAFDAFIGAPDRHAMNWGVLAPLTPDGGEVRFAPVFDTARGLFREISDADLQKKAQARGREKFLSIYAERSRPILGAGDDGQLNHFELVNWIFEKVGEEDCAAMRTVFDAVDLCQIEHMLQRRFRRMITQDRIAFIRDLLSLRIQHIRREVRR